MTFKLDEQLKKDSILAATQHDIQIRLVNDSRYFWMILVPAITKDGGDINMREIHDLPAAVASDLWSLTSHLSKNLKAYKKADKINIAAIGNIVSQLHLHIVARHKLDPCWPAPIWGQGKLVPLSPEKLAKRLESIQTWQSKFSGMI